LAAANACTCSTVVVDDVVVDVDVDVDDVVDESKKHDRQSSVKSDCSSSIKSTRDVIFHECCLNMASNRRYDTVLL